MRIATQRLILDPLRAGDAADLFKVRGDPEVMAFWDWPADDNAGVTADIVSTMLVDVADGTAHYFSIRARDDYGVLGLCDLSEVKNGRSADIGFMLARTHWRKGLGREAVAALIAHARAPDCACAGPGPRTALGAGSQG